MPEQTYKGYLRGVRGILVTPLELSGAMPGTPANYWVDTAQEVDLSAEIVEGEAADLRGGDRQLVRIEEESTVVGVDLSFRDARFDAKLTEIIAGGALVTEDGNASVTILGVKYEAVAAGIAGNSLSVEIVQGTGTSVATSAVAEANKLTVTLGTDGSGDPLSVTATELAAVTITGADAAKFTTTVVTGTTVQAVTADTDLTGGVVIVGWEAPKVSEQSGRTPFQAKVYVQSFNSEGGREAYLVYEFRYCKGYVPEITHGDRAWGTPEFEITARENPSTGLSTYKKTFAAVLPNEAVV